MKERFYILFLLFSSFFCMGRNSYSQDTNRPKIALVLSGGGAKGFAHIGALKIIEGSGIPIDLIVGNSMGSIVGGMYSIGYTASEIEQLARTTQWEDLFSDEVQRSLLSQDIKTFKQRYWVSIPVNDKKKPIIPYSVIEGQNILNLLCGLMANVPDNADFNKFPIPFACVGADISTGHEIIIRNGFLPTAIYSSMSIPGVFLPEEHNGYLMVDGGIVNNFPIDIAKQMGADIIIGVDIRSDLYDKSDIKTMRQLADQLINFYTIDKDSVIKDYCNVLIRPDIDGYSASSFYPAAVDSLINRGIHAATKKLPEIEGLIRDYKLTSKEKSRNLVDKNVWYIKNISFSGNYSINKNLIQSTIDLPLPGAYSYKQIKASIDKIYGLGCFKKVFFKLKDTDKGKELQLVLKEKSEMNFNVGMRVNNADAVSLLLNYTQKDYRRYIGFFSLTADISSNPGFDIRSEISRGSFPTLGFSLSGKYKNYDLFMQQEKYANAGIYYGNAKIYTQKTYGKYSLLGFGYSGEFYTGDIFSSATDSLMLTAGGNTFISNLYACLTIDNLDDYYFPEKGTETYIEGGIFEDNELNNINPFALLKIRNYLTVQKHLTLLMNLHARAIFTTDYPVLKANFVGGHDYELFFDNHLPFYGKPPLSISERYTAVGLMGLRLQLAGKHYISSTANILAKNEDITKLENTSFIWGGGFTYSFRSMIGPIEFTLAYSEDYKKPILSLNLGLWF